MSEPATKKVFKIMSDINTKPTKWYKDKNFVTAVISGVLMPLVFFYYASRSETKIEKMDSLLSGQSKINEKLYDQNDKQNTVIGQLDEQNRELKIQVGILKDLAISSKKQDSTNNLQLYELKNVVNGTTKTISAINSQLQVNQQALTASLEQLKISNTQRRMQAQNAFFPFYDSVKPIQHWQWYHWTHILATASKSDALVMEEMQRLLNRVRPLLANAYVNYDTTAYKLTNKIIGSWEVIYQSLKVRYPEEGWFTMPDKLYYDMYGPQIYKNWIEAKETYYYLLKNIEYRKKQFGSF